MTGVIHLAGDLTLSRFEWGRRIAEAFDHDPNLIKPTSEIAGAAPRPLKGGLNVDKAKGLDLPIYSPIDGLAALKELEHDGDKT
jgi:dTDP-4-dehydrorhamnose reductase